MPILQLQSDHTLETLNKMRILASHHLEAVLALYEQDIEHHNSQPSYQDQKIRARNLRLEMKEPRQEHQRKASGTQSSLKGRKESAIDGKEKDSAQGETHAVSATTRTNVANQRGHPLLLQNRRRKAMGKILR